jgi:N-sulfoglucosamine sulfohydrolase
MNLMKKLLLIIAGVSIFTLTITAQPRPRPNVLFVMSDDHSAAHVGAYGNADIKTPNLDAFAQEGMLFKRMYVAAPQCVPSRAALMTGRSPVAIQMTRFSAPLAEEYKTWLELLRASGYYAGVAGRSFHLDGGANVPESKAVFDAHSLQTFKRRLDYVNQGGSPAQALTQYREFLDQAKGKPFALQLCFSDPHRPLDANAIPTPHDPNKIKLPAHYPDTPAVRADFAKYYDEISRFDSNFKLVLDELITRGLSDNTIVVFQGDNGASQFRGKGTLYEYGLNVPLMVRWPQQVKAGSTSSELISGEDLAPTLLEACGAKPLKEMTGRSFVKLLRGDATYAPRQYAFAERGAHGAGLPNGTAPFDLGRVVIGKRYKLVYNALWQIPYQPVDFANTPMWKELEQMNKDGKLSPLHSRLLFSPTRSMFELFDLEADPNEFTNLIGKPEHAQLEKELKTKLQEWMILERDYLPLPIPPAQ